MGTLVSSVASLLHWWWRCDRIRASPREGRLLRLTPPCFVRIAGEPAEVVSRQVVCSADGPAIVHRCSAPAGSFALTVWPAAGGVAIEMRRGGAAHALTEDDVEVIPGAACSRRSSC
jgi:hypothetical protein